MESRKYFFIVGAQRSATTYLYRLLDEHPEIQMAKPERPEPKYFLHRPIGVSDYEERFFPEHPGQLVRGEKSTSYMESEKAAAGIAQTFPKAHIIFLLRDPVERAISHYEFSIENGLEKLRFEEALEQEESRWQNFDPALVSVSPFAYQRRGRYIDFLKIYENFFPHQQIHVLIHEELISGSATIAALYRTLGVDDAFVPSGIGSKINQTTKTGAVISDACRQYLNSSYREPNRELAEHLELKTLPWA